MAAPTIQNLVTELSSILKGLPAFTKSGFSAFDVDDLAYMGTINQWPIAGVVYDGAVRPDAGGKNVGSAVAQSSNSVALATMQFTIVIGIQYHNGARDDTKVQATDLLDEIRNKVMGYKGVNTRPWLYVGEKPEPAASGDGYAYYSQTWQTAVSVVGTFETN